MSREKNIEKAANQLYKAATTSTLCPPVRDLLDKEDILAAYNAQAINIARRIHGGAEVIGKKIGLTSFAVQAQLGVDQPDYGILLDDMLLKNGASLPFNTIQQPKAEAEIAFVLQEDLAFDTITESSLLRAIEYATVAIEIAGSRVKDWDITIVDTIADNASASHFVLGDSRVLIEDVDLINCKMDMTKNGDVMSTGIGKNCMDSPLLAALWLARTMQQHGQPLRAGEIIMSGALGPMVNVVAGDNIKATIEGFGEAAISIV